MFNLENLELPNLDDIFNPKKTIIKYQKIFAKPDILDKNINDFFDSNKRFLIYTGGRGGGKSTSILLSILEEMRKDKYHNRDIVFARNFKELLNETKEKVKEAIQGSSILSKEFIFNNKEYKNIKTNSFIKFIGLNDFLDSAQTKHKNNSKLKSFNNVAIFFIDEADHITEKQLSILIPTLRKTKIKYILEEDNHNINIGDADSKFLFALNPFNPNGDDIINRFKYDEKAIYHHINLLDLPIEWQDKNILDSYNSDYNRMKNGEISQDAFNHIWLGFPALEDNFQPFSKCNFLNIDNIGEYNKFNNGICFIDTSNGGDYNAVSCIWRELLNDGSFKLGVYGFCKKGIGWSDFIEQYINYFKYFQERGFKIYYESNNVGKEPYKLFNRYGVQSYFKPTNIDKKVKIQSIYQYLKYTNILQDDFNLNKEYNKLLLSYTQSSKNDDAPDSLAMAMRLLLNIK